MSALAYHKCAVLRVGCTSVSANKTIERRFGCSLFILPFFVPRYGAGDAFFERDLWVVAEELSSRRYVGDVVGDFT